MNLLVREAREADREAIRRIRERSPGAAPWDPEGEPCLVGEAEGGVAGFLVWRTVAAGEHELLNLAVAPGRRRRGIASALLEEAFRRAPGEWFLEVRESNGAALAFYRERGFRPSGTRPEYYANPPEAAIVMHRST